VHHGSSLYGLDADLLHDLEPDVILTQDPATSARSRTARSPTPSG
jgi:hypothetical protein